MSPQPRPGSPTAALAQRVRQLRDTRGLSQSKLAALLDTYGVSLTREQLANLEAGRRQSVTVEQVFALAYALNCSPTDLLTPADSGELMRIGDQEVRAQQVRTWMHGGGPLPLPIDALDDVENAAEFTREREREFHAAKPAEEYRRWQASGHRAVKAAQSIVGDLEMIEAEGLEEVAWDAKGMYAQLDQQLRAVTRHVRALQEDLRDMDEGEGEP